jgi:hypothetical protein
MSKAKSNLPKRNPKSISRALPWIVIMIVILITAGLFYWVNNTGSKTGKQMSPNPASTSDMSADLIRANQLTREVFHYVELVETNQMTKEEADRLSGPIKTELQNLRSQLSKEELAVNDSIRKVMGNIMVNNVMKTRK